MIRWNESYGQWVVEKELRGKRLFRRIPGSVGRDMEAEARELAAKILEEFRSASLEDQGPPGYLYALEAECLPGMLKIGMTTKTPEGRCKELAIMLPTGCALVHAVTVRRVRSAESEAHQALADRRVNPRREWFRVDRKTAIATLNRISEAQQD